MTRMSRNRARLALLAALLPLTLSTPAAAHHLPFPDNADEVLFDNNEHTWCFASEFTSDDMVLWAMTNLDDQTDMFDNDIAVCGVTTDIWWWDSSGSLDPGVRGSWRCVFITQFDECDTGDVDLDFVNIDPGDWDTEDRRAVAVHEVGHSVGLGHTNLGAMISGQIPDPGSEWQEYDSHDVSAINAHY